MGMVTGTKRARGENRVIALDDGGVAIEVRRRNGEALHYRIDKEDVAKVRQRQWFAHNGYCCTLKDNRFWYLGWELLGRPKKGYVLCYLNGDREDNRKANLHRLTWSQRNLLEKRRPNRSTGIRGISRYKNGLYIVTVGPRGRRKSFRDREDAVAARASFERRAENRISRSTHLKLRLPRTTK